MMTTSFLLLAGFLTAMAATMSALRPVGEGSPEHI